MYTTIHSEFKFQGLGQQHYFSSLKIPKPPLRASYRAAQKKTIKEETKTSKKQMHGTLTELQWLQHTTKQTKNPSIFPHLKGCHLNWS